MDSNSVLKLIMFQSFFTMIKLNSVDLIESKTLAEFYRIYQRFFYDTVLLLKITDPEIDKNIIALQYNNLSIKDCFVLYKKIWEYIEKNKSKYSN